MPLAPSAQELTNIPTIPFVPNPALFDASTQRNHHTPFPSIADPGDGMSTPTQNLPQAGILSGIWLTYTGTLTVAPGGGSATTKSNWPYGLLSTLDFSANFQSNIVHATGPDLHVHRFVSNPALPATGIDRFPGTIGGGNTLTAGPTTISLTWFVPIAADQSTLAGAIYAQSASNLLTLQLRRAALADLITYAGGATATLTGGNFTVATDFFDIPRDPASGAVVTPDLRRIHSLNYFDLPFTATGQLKIPLIPVNGNLLRLFVRLTSPSGDFSPIPANASGWTSLDVHYGANKNPQRWDLNSLVQRNAGHYGGLVPYNYVVLDLMRENPVRDAIVMTGVTDLAILVNINTGTSVPANSAVHVVQETLYS
jgi:hypothetical protein